MRIFGHECWKLFSGKVLLGVILGLFVTNLFLGYYSLTQRNEFGYSIADEAKVYEVLYQYPKSEWEEVIGKEIENTYAIMSSPQYTDGRFSEDAIGDFLLLQQVSGYLEEERGYSQYLEELRANANEMTSTSLWGSASQFVIRNAEKTIRAYEHLDGLEMTADITGGLSWFFANRVSDVFVLMAMVAILLRILIGERDTGAIYLLKSLKNGRLGLIASKAAVAIVSCLCLSILFYAGNLLLVNQVVGLGDVNRPIQAVQGFFSSPLRISVGVAIPLFLLLKFLSFLVVVAVLFFIFIYLRSRTLSCLIGCLILGMSRILYGRLSLFSWAGFLKPWCFMGFLDTAYFLDNYRTVNYFNWPVEYNSVCALAAVVCFFGCLAASFWCFSVEKDSSTRGILVLAFQQKQKRSTSIKLHTNLFWHEVYKLFKGQHAVVVVIALLAIQCFIYLPARPALNAEDKYYEQYCNLLQGPLDSEKELLLQQELSDMEESNRKAEWYSELKSTGKLSTEVADYYIRQYQVPYEREMAFERVSRQYDALLTLQSDVPSIEFQSQTIWEDFLGDEGARQDIINAGMLSVSLILCFSGMEPMETLSQVEVLISASPRGSKSVKRRKTIISVCLSIVLMLISFVPHILRLKGTWNISTEASCHSVLLWENLPPKFSVYSGFVLIWVDRVIGVVFASQLIICISQKTKQTSFAMLVAAAILLTPAFTAFLGLTGEGPVLSLMTGHLHKYGILSHILCICVGLFGSTALLYSSLTQHSGKSVASAVSD